MFLLILISKIFTINKLSQGVNNFEAVTLKETGGQINPNDPQII